MSARELALRALGSLAAVGALTAVGLLRLSRVPRPEAVVVARYARGEVTQARVALGAHTLGYSLRCDGREVFARAGTRPLTVFELPIEARTALVVGDGARALTLVMPGCEAQIREGAGVIRRVTRDASEVVIEARESTVRWRP